MTSNPRRPGFRLPWSSDEEGEAATAAAESATLQTADPPAPDAAGAAPDVEAAAAAASVAEPTSSTPPVAPEPADPVEDEQPQEFLRELVAAMRRVADETRQSGLADAKARAAARVKQLEADGERRRRELSAGAEKDIAAVGEWAKAEAERIKAEAERRVSARRTQLDVEVAADRARGEAEAKAVADRIGEYESELEAFHAQLARISDPAAFAAAAKRMPRPPVLEAGTRTSPAAAAGADPAAAAPPITTNGQQPSSSEVHPAEEEVLSARLAELDASLPAHPGPTAAPVTAAAAEVTEVVVSGLGSFGAITSFRQALADVDGVQGVALSLGGSGEFVFRASHRTGFDIAAAITSLEGDAAKVQPRPEGGLLVKLERRR